MAMADSGGVAAIEGRHRHRGEGHATAYPRWACPQRRGGVGHWRGGGSRRQTPRAAAKMLRGVWRPLLIARVPLLRHGVGASDRADPRASALAAASSGRGVVALVASRGQTKSAVEGTTAAGSAASASEEVGIWGSRSFSVGTTSGPVVKKCTTNNPVPHVRYTRDICHLPSGSYRISRARTAVSRPAQTPYIALSYTAHSLSNHSSQRALHRARINRRLNARMARACTQHDTGGHQRRVHHTVSNLPA